MDDAMDDSMQQLAAAASAQQKRMTGRTPRAVTGALSNNTLVLTLHDALTPAERALAQRPTGAAQVEEFQKQLFYTSSASMCDEIKRVIGQDVRELALGIVRDAREVNLSYRSGTVVQVYLLSPIPGQTSTAGEGLEMD